MITEAGKEVLHCKELSKCSCQACPATRQETVLPSPLPDTAARSQNLCSIPQQYQLFKLNMLRSIDFDRASWWLVESPCFALFSPRPCQLTSGALKESFLPLCTEHCRAFPCCLWHRIHWLRAWLELAVQIQAGAAGTLGSEAICMQPSCQTSVMSSVCRENVQTAHAPSFFGLPPCFLKMKLR